MSREEEEARHACRLSIALVCVKYNDRGLMEVVVWLYALNQTYTRSVNSRFKPPPNSLGR
jgi:hypothetical protein